MTVKRLTFLSGVIASTLWLTACSSQERAEQALSLGWVGPTSAALANQTNVKPLYCYSTLGAPECYEAKKPEWEHRLIHFYEPSEATASSQKTQKFGVNEEGILMDEEGEDPDFDSALNLDSDSDSTELKSDLDSLCKVEA